MSLGGNHEAAQAMRDLLMDKYDYDKENITLLIDGSNWYVPPWQINEMKRLVSDAQDGDRFAFFFSGHGDQMKAVNDKNETDGMDEFIIPIDHRIDNADNMNIILDNEIKDLLVIPIQYKSVNLVGIFDCCHSGTIMDLYEYTYSGDATYTDSPTDMEPPRSPVRATMLDVQDLSRSARRRFGVQVRRDPLALERGYAVQWTEPRTDDGVQGTSQPAARETDEGNKRTGQRSATHPNHLRFLHMNPLTPDRSPSLPAVTPALRLDPYPLRFRVRGLGTHSLVGGDKPSAAESNVAIAVRASYKACVTSWSACADDELNWENARGEAMGTPMVQYLDKDPKPTYDRLLSHLAQVMRENGKERQEAWKRAGQKEKVTFQRPQLGSLQELDLQMPITI